MGSFCGNRPETGKQGALKTCVHIFYQYCLALQNIPDWVNSFSQLWFFPYHFIIEIKEEEEGNEHLLSTMCPESSICAQKGPKFSCLWSFLEWSTNADGDSIPHDLTFKNLFFLNNSTSCQKMCPRALYSDLCPLSPWTSPPAISLHSLPSVINPAVFSPPRSTPGVNKGLSLFPESTTTTWL